MFFSFLADDDNATAFCYHEGEDIKKFDLLRPNMNSIEQIQQAFSEFLHQQFGIDKLEAESCTFELNVDEAKEQFGDLSSNAALVLSKKLKKNPKAIAQEIIDTFHHEYLRDLNVAGAGFVNAFLTNTVLQNLTQEMFDQKETFFKPDDKKQLQHYNIEFVSANPTGPLHFGHGRGGIIGDVAGNVLKFVGNNVTKEFYVNDAGSQIQKLAVSFKIRCEQQLGNDIQLPEDAYHGQYLTKLAEQCIKEHGKATLEKPLTFFAEYTKEKMMAMQEETLKEYGIHFDVWFSEKSLHESNAIEHAVNILEKNGYIYEADGALWFAATKFGDDKDRVIRKSTGEWTYMAPDIAYLVNKVERGFNHLIMILGHDHHSYAVRLEAVRQALGLKAPLDVILYQLVKIKEGGQFMRMSKRAGRMITLRDIIETVGKDVARFFYLNRKADAQLEFNLDLALKKTEENPVYYVQYAYVRTNSILAKASAEKDLGVISNRDISAISHEEAGLLKKIASLKSLLSHITINYQTHLLTYYLIDLATTFHRYYAKHRVIDLEKIEQSRSRLLLIKVLNQTFTTCLDLLGISKPEKM